MQILPWLWSFFLELQKKSEEENAIVKDDQWTEVQKAGNSNQGPRKKGKGKSVNGDAGKPRADGLPKAPPNPFAVLSPPKDFLEEGEVQKFKEHELESKVNSAPQEQVGPSPPGEGDLSLPICATLLLLRFLGKEIPLTLPFVPALLLIIRILQGRSNLSVLDLMKMIPLSSIPKKAGSQRRRFAKKRLRG